MSNKFDDVALCAAHTTIENLLVDIDGEAVVATAHWARTNKFSALALELNATPRDFVLNRRGARSLDVGGGDHTAPLNLSAIDASQSHCFCVGWPPTCAYDRPRRAKMRSRTAPRVLICATRCRELAD
jgi:hypothetical protein